MSRNYPSLIIVLLLFLFGSCKKNSSVDSDLFPSINETFKGKIDLNNLPNYENQNVPAYITKDNTNGNVISNEKAILGRVLFYDTNFSLDNSISCGSCHLQQFAFGDTALGSKGVLGGVTPRHSMRLINGRFGEETHFFWNERVKSLEEQTTKPMRGNEEMGFSGLAGRPNFDDLLFKLSGVHYLGDFFTYVYGDNKITEARIQECLAQFVRSIQSFDSKYDVGRAQVANDAIDFPNFSSQENLGKQLFLKAPVFDSSGQRIAGGLGCAGCHRPPEFDIDPATGNNGFFMSRNGSMVDLDNTRAPSLRDVVGPNGTLNTPLMHTASIFNLVGLLMHYNNIQANSINTKLDNRLQINGHGQQLNLTVEETEAVITFLKTLTGSDVYTNEKWSNPFL